jgi:hypothetical protein
MAAELKTSEVEKFAATLKVPGAGTEKSGHEHARNRVLRRGR